MFFKEDGTLDVDGLLVNNTSFKTIMEDGVITVEEVEAQTEKVASLLRAMEAKYDKAVMDDVMNLMSEACIMYAVSNYLSIQNLDEE